LASPFFKGEVEPRGDKAKVTIAEATLCPAVSAHQEDFLFSCLPDSFTARIAAMNRAFSAVGPSVRET
jgi:hypothetical protein